MKDWDDSNDLTRRRAIGVMGAGALVPAFWGKLTNKNRGKYFAKKEYIDEPLPRYEESKHLLPSPILDGDPGLVEVYWKCWSLAFDHMKKPEPGSGLVSNFLDEAFNPDIFQWDTIFMVMFARYGHHVFPAIQSLDNFYARQHADGFICREIIEADGRDYFPKWAPMAVNPPLFSWAEMENYRVTGDASRFAEVAAPLAKYVEWLETGRKKRLTAHGLYWNDPLGSGMDNTPRSGSGWVDMSCQMARQYRDLAAIHSALGRDSEAAEFKARAGDIAARIDKWMWNGDDGLYYDVDGLGRQVKWKTAGCFWPMMAGVTTPEKEERLIENLKDPNSFWRKNVFPALAADQKHYDPTGRYWRGGVWAPTNYAIIRGLALTGHHDFGREAAEKYLAGIYEVYQRTGTVWELYAPDLPRPGTGTQGERGGQARPDFVGWTGCGPIAMLIENLIGLDADAPANRLTWRIGRTDRHGIENFRMGPLTVSLVCEARPSSSAPAEITVKADRDFELAVTSGGAEKKFSLAAGEHHLQIAG